VEEDLRRFIRDIGAMVSLVILRVHVSAKPNIVSVLKATAKLRGTLLHTAQSGRGGKLKRRPALKVGI
jgi:hypothetical protein